MNEPVAAPSHRNVDSRHGAPARGPHRENWPPASRPAQPAEGGRRQEPPVPSWCPQIGLLRHVHPADRATATCSRPIDSATATCSPRRSRYCDMFAPSRPRYCDMFTPQIGLLRHVRAQPTPLLRHVHPADPATATCSRPADPATATCSPRRSRYCDMFAPSRPPLLRHVHPADRATATCPSPGRLVRNGVSGQRRRAVTGGNLQLDFSTSPPRPGKNGGQSPSE